MVQDRSRNDGGGPGRGLRRDALANQERVLAAAVTAMLREGRNVPMAKIAADAGVGVATLYRRYPTREALLDALTERSFRMVLAVAQEAAERDGTALAAIDHFLDRTIDHRAELVLPLHGGPTKLSVNAWKLRSRVHAVVARLLERGRLDGTIQADVTTRDVVVFGAMLAQPLAPGGAWDAMARRQKVLFVRGLHAHVAGGHVPT